MKEGTAADMATLGLINKFDNNVMLKAFKFLNDLTPAKITPERFPYYGHFYGAMGMHLLKQEFGEAKEYRDKTQAFIDGVQQELLKIQAADG